MNAKERDKWSRRLALQIATQLPDEQVDAMLVLSYARELVDWSANEDKKRPALVALPGRQREGAS